MLAVVSFIWQDIQNMSEYIYVFACSQSPNIEYQNLLLLGQEFFFLLAEYWSTMGRVVDDCYLQQEIYRNSPITLLGWSWSQFLGVVTLWL
jgi:hypothetical protein